MNTMQSAMLNANVAALVEPSTEEIAATRVAQAQEMARHADAVKKLYVVDAVMDIDVPAFSSGILFRLRWIAQSFVNSLFIAATAKVDDNQPNRVDDLKSTAKMVGVALASMIKRCEDLGVQFHDDAVEAMVASAVTEWCNGGRFNLKDEQIKARAAALGCSEEKAKELMQVQSLNYSNRMAANRPTAEVMIPKVWDSFCKLEPLSLSEVRDWTKNGTIGEDADAYLWSIIEASGQNILTSWDNAAIFIVRSWFGAYGVHLQLPEVKVNADLEAAAQRKREFEARRALEQQAAAARALDSFEL